MGKPTLQESLSVAVSLAQTSLKIIDRQKHKNKQRVITTLYIQSGPKTERFWR